MNELRYLIVSWFLDMCILVICADMIIHMCTAAVGDRVAETCVFACCREAVSNAIRLQLVLAAWRETNRIKTCRLPACHLDSCQARSDDGWQRGVNPRTTKHQPISRSMTSISTDIT